jgi:replicative DNA helicase
MDLDLLALNSILSAGKLEPFIEAGLTVEDFEGPAKEIAAFVYDYWKNPRYKGQLPTAAILKRHFVSFTPAKPEEQPEWVIDELRKRTKYNTIVRSMSRIGAAMKKNDLTSAAQCFHQGGSEIARLDARTKVVDLTRNMAERKARYQSRRDKINLYGISSGFPWIDKWTLGWQPGDLVFILGKRGTGKTWLTMLMAYAAQMEGYPVMVISREMDILALERRYDAIHAKLPYQAFRRGELGHQLEQQYYQSLDAMKELAPFYLPKFEGPCTPSTIQAMARELKVKLVAIDGVYLVDDDEGQSRWEKHFNVGRGLKLGLCNTDRMVCIINNQLNRDEDPKFATLDNSAYSDAYGQFADVAMKLNLDRENREMLMQLLKVREDDMPLDPTRVQWDLENMAFGQLDDDSFSGIDPEQIKY